jgi:hypothetical protein
MGNDHTSGTTPGKIAPLSAAADNDQGVGMLVEAVSKSRFWNETAIFMIEDDAQNGPDHVDSHRAPAWVISPWVKRHTVNSTMYNQASVLRTMEIILGLHPMTTYDAGARPMFSVFNEGPSPQPYTAEKPRTPLDTRNPANSPTAERSLRMNFDRRRRHRRRRTQRHPLGGDQRTQRSRASAGESAGFRTNSTSCRKSICAFCGTCISRSIRTWCRANTAFPGRACTR